MTVWSHQPLSQDEAAELLNTVLNEKGYTAIRSGRTLTLVKRDEARMRDLPVRTGANPDAIAKSDEMVTQIIPVRYADALKLIENLRPLIPSYATLTANESSNALVLTDTQSNVRRMVEIVQSLDTSISSISEFKVFPLNYADAADLAEVLNKVFEAQGTAGGSSVAAREESSSSSPECVAGRRGSPRNRPKTGSVARQAASRGGGGGRRADELIGGRRSGGTHGDDRATGPRSRYHGGGYHRGEGVSPAIRGRGRNGRDREERLRGSNPDFPATATVPEVFSRTARPAFRDRRLSRHPADGRCKRAR